MSVKVRRVLGDNSPSFIVSVLFCPGIPSAIAGVALAKTIGRDPENDAIPEAVIFVAPLIAPVLVMPPLLLFIPPVTDAPPDETVSKPPMVCAVVKLLF